MFKRVVNVVLTVAFTTALLIGVGTTRKDVVYAQIDNKAPVAGANLITKDMSNTFVVSENEVMKATTEEYCEYEGYVAETVEAYNAIEEEKIERKSTVAKNATTEDLSSEPMVEDKPAIDPINAKGNGDGFVKILPNLDEDIQRYIYKRCNELNIDYYLVMALIFNESGGRVKVISKYNDCGLMQINVCAQKDGVDYLDPYQNVDEGLAILKDKFEKFEDPSLTLMAYNIGDDGARKKIKNGIYSTSYSRKILKVQKEMSDGTFELTNY